MTDHMYVCAKCNKTVYNVCVKCGRREDSAVVVYHKENQCTNFWMSSDSPYYNTDEKEHLHYRCQCGYDWTGPTWDQGAWCGSTGPSISPKPENKSDANEMQLKYEFNATEATTFNIGINLPETDPYDAFDAYTIDQHNPEHIAKILVYGDQKLRLKIVKLLNENKG